MNAVNLCIVYSSIIIVHSSDCDIRTPCTISYNLALHIAVLIHFIINSVAAAAPKSYYEYDSQKQINASEA